MPPFRPTRHLTVLATLLTLPGCGPFFAHANDPITTRPASAGALSVPEAPVVVPLGQQLMLAPLVKGPGGAAAPTGLIWSSTNTQVAAVSGQGQLTGKAPGEAIVTVVDPNSNAQATIRVTVSAGAAVTLVEVTPATPVIKPGELVKLTARVNMADGSVNANVSWSSSDGTIASVNPTTGEVTGLKEGRATVVATYVPDGTYKGLADVVVGAGTASAQPADVVFGPGGEAESAPRLSKVQVPLDYMTVSAIDMVDARVGYAMADGGRAKKPGHFIKTVDGGFNWKPVAMQVPEGAVGGTPFGEPLRAQSFAFTDAQHGFILIPDRLGSKPAPDPLNDTRTWENGGYWLEQAGAIYETKDGGVTWAPVQPFTGGMTLGQLKFVSPQVGFAYGPSNPHMGGTGKLRLLVTTDGGKTWLEERTLDKPDVQRLDVAMWGGTLLLSLPGQVLKLQADGWKTVLNTGAPDPNALLPRLALRSPMEGMAVSSGNVVHTTAVGGETWQKAPFLDAARKPLLALGVTSRADQLVFVDALNGFVLTPDGTGRTTDGGQSWRFYPEKRMVFGDFAGPSTMMMPTYGSGIYRVTFN